MKVIKSGKLRGHRYTISEDRAGRTKGRYTRTPRYVVTIFDDQGAYATQHAKTYAGALSKLEWMTHGQWKHELRHSNPISKSLKSGNSEDAIEHNILVLMAQGYSETQAAKAAIRLSKSSKESLMKRNAVYENPISTTQWYLIAAGLLGAGVVAYELMKKPAAAAGAVNAITLAPGAMSATIGSGLTLNLPSGAVWAPGFQGAGTSTPLQVPASPTTVGQAQTTPLTWTDATGTPQTTMLTLTA